MPWSLRIALIVLRATSWPRLFSPPGFACSPRLSLVHVKRFLAAVAAAAGAPSTRGDTDRRMLRDVATYEDDLSTTWRPTPGAPDDGNVPALAAGRSTPEPIHTNGARGTRPDRPRTATRCRRRSGSARRAACRCAWSRARRPPEPGDGETTPTARGVAQAGPEGRGRDAPITDRQRPNPLCRWQAGEKILDGRAVLADGRHHRGEFCHQGPHQPGLSPPHVGRHGQLRLLEDVPELPGSGSRSSDGRAPTAATDVS